MNPKMCQKEQLEWLKIQLTDWQAQGLVSSESQQSILAQYQIVQEEKSQLASILLVVLGAILIGGGVILLFAHNWDQLGKGVRTLLSFLPLLLAQALCWYALKFQSKSSALRESSSVFLFFSIASSIALIGQTYHIYGDLERFVLTWVLLSIPIIYVMRSSAILILVSLLLIWLCTFNRSPYWLLYLSLVPIWIYSYQQQNGGSLAFLWSSWIAALAIPISLIVSIEFERSPLTEYLLAIMLVVAVFYYLLGKKIFGFTPTRFWSNPLSSLGAMGIIIFSLLLSWTEAWDIGSSFDSHYGWRWSEYLLASLFIGCFVLTIWWWFKHQTQLHRANKVFTLVVLFALAPLLKNIVGVSDPIFAALMNVFILVASILVIAHGINSGRLVVLNAGLLWLSVLLLLRFFDSDISFVLKGIIFILIGCGFIVANIWFKRQQQLKERQL
ncbi:MAG: DUF2157 domain-containing protein [Kangiellaceae bacterium]|nr:DUF2157 domain-containing protein [Kangiellaceae bacterium]